jgi:hypothetical protein
MHHPIEEVRAIPIAHHCHHYKGQLLKGETDKPLLWGEEGVEIIIDC